MPRRVTSKIHDYFIFYIDRSICQVLTAEGNICNTEIKGRHAGNLEKHVRVWHQEEWKNYWENKTLMLSQNENTILNPALLEEGDHSFTQFVNVTVADIANNTYSYVSTPTPKKRKIASNKTTNTHGSIHVNLCYTDIEKYCIEMVTVNGLPFSIVEESGFRRILDPLLKGCGKPRDQCPITKKRVQKLVKSKAAELRSRIMEEVENKVLSLQIACASLQNNLFLSFSIQFRDEDDLFSVTLAIVEIDKNYSVDSLRKIILRVLNEYKITIQQIYYISVVSNPNIRNLNFCNDECGEGTTEKDILTNIEIVKVENISSPNDNDDNSDYDFESVEIEETQYDETEQEEEIEYDDDSKSKNDTEKLVTDVLESLVSEENVLSFRCLSHFLQLAVLDSFKTNEHNAFLKKIRNIVTKCLSTNNLHILKTLKCKKKPILDCDTRLLSVYDMLERLLEIKPFLGKLFQMSDEEMSITADEWVRISNTADSLKPCKVASIRFQQNDFTLSQYYKLWITCFLKTKKIDSALSRDICKNLEKYQNTLFENIAFKSAILLDPRLKNTLNKEDQEEIIDHLVQLFERILTLKPADDEADETDSVSQIMKKQIKVESGVDEDSDDDLYNYVQSIVKDRATEQKGSKDRILDLRIALQSFCDSEPLLEIQNVVNFWCDKKYLFKDIYSLAQIIYSITPVNVSKDKVISQLKYLSNYGKGINSLVKDVLLIRTNFHLI